MKNLFFLFLFSICELYSQQKMDVLKEVRYELKFKEYKNQNDVVINNFILLMNNSESFFKNMNIYVKDSLFANGTLKYTNTQKDLEINMRFYVELPFTIYRKGKNVSFANSILDNECRYDEEVEFNWKITKDKKVINGIECTKATTTKWGRNWIAYFSTKHPLPFGPYKFYGLPGLIFEVGDDNKDYVFTLYKIKNRKVKNFNLYNYPKAKKVTKEQYEKIRHSEAIKPSQIKVEGDPSMAKKINKRKLEREKNYNPIELIQK